MTEQYGPDDPSVPSWEAPSGEPLQASPGYSSGKGFSSPPPPSGSGPVSAPQGVPTFRSWQPGFMPLRPLNLGDFLSLPLKAIGANRQVILGGPLLCTILTMLAATVTITLVVREQSDYFFTYYGRWQSMGSASIAAIIVTVLLGIGTDAAARTLVIPGVSRGILGEKITLGKAWAISWPRVPQVLLLYLVVTLGIVALILVTAILGVLSAGVLTIPIILALIPGALFLSVVTGVAVSAVVLERLSAPRAFARAFSLVKGNSWRLIGCYFVVFLVLYFANGAISGVTQAVIFALGLTSPSLATLIIVMVILTLITTVVSSMIWYSFMGTVLTLIYVDLRIRNEGFDLDLAQAAEASARR